MPNPHPPPASIHPNKFYMRKPSSSDVPALSESHRWVSYAEKEASAERGRAPSELSEDDLTWIVDPIDGTTNFVHGFPVTCVSMGLVRGDEVSQRALRRRSF